jgi:TetR/AcrR family transcriptional repressor of nem operon
MDVRDRPEMGRNKSFDETEVLDKAVRRFWTGGYRATSVRDLEQATGLTTASLYNAFGDKKSLFRSALQRYLDLSTRRRIALLETSPQPLAAIEAFLGAVVEASSSSRDGCLLVNSAVEVAAHDDEIGADVATALREVEAALLVAVCRGQADGSITADVEASRLATSIMGTVVAIRVLSRLPVEPHSLQVLAENQIATLRAGARSPLAAAIDPVAAAGTAR